MTPSFRFIFKFFLFIDSAIALTFKTRFLFFFLGLVFSSQFKACWLEKNQKDVDPGPEKGWVCGLTVRSTNAKGLLKMSETFISCSFAYFVIFHRNFFLHFLWIYLPVTFFSHINKIVIIRFFIKKNPKYSNSNT
mgnify:CR=1 FL=1